MAQGFVSHLDLNVSDPAASTAFYALLLEPLGYRRENLDRDGRCVFTLTYDDDTIFGIEIRSPREPGPRDNHERYSPGIDHLAFQVDNRADVDATANRLAAAGYVVADPPADYDYSPGYYATAFDDPDGIRLEVVHDPTKDTRPVPVTISHLEMLDRPTLDRTADELVLGLVATPMPSLNRFFYATVGAEWLWHSRLPWTPDEWTAKLTEPGAETWVASVDHVPVGYAELRHGAEDCEILYFGLLPEATGRGLGPQLLRAALDQAWRQPTTIRVHLTTCTLDHPRALPNYLAGGFSIARTEEIVDQIPRRLLGQREQAARRLRGLITDGLESGDARAATDDVLDELRRAILDADQ